MKKLLLLFTIFFTVTLFSEAKAQDIPLVYDVENTCLNCPIPPPPVIDSLPSISNLPDPFEWADGRGRIQNKSDWRYRRAEISAEIQHYEIGPKPPRPEDIQASFSNGTLTVDVTVNGETLRLSSNINLPDGDGPFPVIIGMGFTSMPDSLFSNRDIGVMNFSHNQVVTYNSPTNNDPYYRLYPEFNIDNTGQYSAWAWGVSRLIDGLQIVAEEANIDTEHLAVSGCSYAGKMAIFSGALDERIALTFGIESGGGGYTTWRYSEVINQTESVENLRSTNFDWFKNDMAQFSNSVDKLPMDHHELMAMVAPRALFVTGNPGWTWLADESGYVGSRATEKVYEALGISDRFAYSQIGGHNHCAIPAAQIPEITSFLDRYLLGIDSVTTDVNTSPYTTNLDPWITWETPTLGNDTTFFEWSELISPANKEEAVDTSLTFTWSDVEEAEKYYIQLSTDPGFTKEIRIDSSSAPSILITGLEKGVQYYWRIQVKNSDGETGPWSNSWSFSTYIPLPNTPTLVTQIPDTSKSGYVEFHWNTALNASSYSIEVSKTSDFTTSTVRSTSEDTLRSLFWKKDGLAYWKVRSHNITGASDWSDVSTFTVVLAPTNLSAQDNGSNEILLTWSDNSSSEEGYLIERKLAGSDTFSIVDTLHGGGNQFTDTEVTSADYVYRVSGFSDTFQSAYSNEASISFEVGTEDIESVPDVFSLSQNYPNPFNPSTTIMYQLAENSSVRLEVFDMTGRKVSTLINGRVSAGAHSVTFDASELTSGVYFYQLRTSTGFSTTRKMILLK